MYWKLFYQIIKSNDELQRKRNGLCTSQAHKMDISYLLGNSNRDRNTGTRHAYEYVRALLNNEINMADIPLSKLDKLYEEQREAIKKFGEQIDRILDNTEKTVKDLTKLAWAIKDSLPLTEEEIKNGEETAESDLKDLNAMQYGK